MIIGICGFAGSGKNTAADYLVDRYKFKQQSYAASLKDAASSIFNWDRNLLEGKTNESREWRETVDTWWAARLGWPDLTPRKVLQQFGTNVCRDHFHQDIWVSSLENKLLSETENVVITDCRFQNEIQVLRNVNSKLLCITKLPLPNWFDLVIEANHGNMDSLNQLMHYGVHTSEIEWVGTSFDYEIDNNGSKDELYLKIDQIFS